MRIVVAPPVPNEFVIRVPGPQGPKGDKGTLWLSGTTAPAAGLGLIDDWYLNTITGDTYQKTGLTTWVQTGNIKGATGTINVGSVTTGTAGSSVVVTNVGTPTNAIFNFTIPKGDKGDRATLAVGTVTTGAPGSAAAVTDTGTASDGILNFTIPRGDTGATGTLSLGTVTTGTPGSSVIITNTGTPTAGVFNFTIPRGDVGPQGVQGVQGDPGPVGPAGLTWRGAWSNAATYAINDHVTWGGSSYYSTTTKAAGQAPPTGTAADPGVDDTAVNAGWALLTMQGATGPQGPQGPQGIQGIQGPQGATGIAEVWYSGAGAPSGATGAVGDWYLNTTNGDVYEKTGASAWTLRANITGPQGPQGIQGIQGPAGSSVNAIFTTSTAAGVPIISRGSASQTGDLMQWQDSTNAVLSKITSSGQIFEGANRVYSLGNKVPVAGLSATGTASATTYLRGDNTWATLPASAVTSVNTRTGAVVGLAEDNAVVHLTGNETIAGIKTFSSAPVVPTGSFAIAATTNLQTTLDAKYSATNVPPYPVTSVATRTGAVTLTAADIAAGNFPAGAFMFSANAVGTVPLVSKAVASQTGDLQQWQSSTGTVLARITAGGGASFDRNGTAGVGFGGLDPLANTSTSIGTVSASWVPLRVRGAASQTANLQEWQNSAGTVLSRVANDGTIWVGTTQLGGGGAGNAADTEIMTIMGGF